MKILFLSPRFYPDIGGVETHVYRVVKELIKRGNEVVIITEGREKSSEANIIRCNFGTSGKMKKFRIWKKLWTLRSQIERADIIHCHDVFFWYLPFRFLYPSKPVVTTFHGYETVFPPERNAIRVRRMSKKLSSRTINIGEYIEKWYQTPADSVLHGGIDTIQIQHSVDIREHKNKTHHILLLGRLENDIGVNVYCEALEILEKKNIAFTFEVCGDGSLRERLQRFGKVHGFVSDPLPYIEKADIVFASSYLSIIEALSRGKKVISVYTNPLKEDYLKMSSFAKWITITDSATHIAAHIRNMHSLPTAHRYTLKKFLESMSWDHVVDIYEKLYEQAKPSR
ncbi:hypothetical protein A3D06_00915 [Candidatus Roizmanbacteria bacterium RIFCSPHIGHO2_02_FULL_40_9]|uniref:Glycosyltransferase subfamily 4-like N-terminal domain-containing protein n=1 Tax=Candidatus Roizmanbacteria bacterium RIFCSPHIGHO2_02_FULL_40_9 TaxID=1802042 RepID=A0A1F7HE03_9BACT|nr:MAG: hypothetical protein A3D06_00915 [Candidatus Roizmanbacteria bacterium RIFCSPHIGHO2_02_FULL_40_9]